MISVWNALHIVCIKTIKRWELGPSNLASALSLFRTAFNTFLYRIIFSLIYLSISNSIEWKTESFNWKMKRSHNFIPLHGIICNHTNIFKQYKAHKSIRYNLFSCLTAMKVSQRKNRLFHKCNFWIVRSVACQCQNSTIKFCSFHFSEIIILFVNCLLQLEMRKTKSNPNRSQIIILYCE